MPEMDVWSLKNLISLGQLKLRITAQDSQLTVTAFELVGLLQRRDTESSAYVRVRDCDILCFNFPSS